MQISQHLFLICLRAFLVEQKNPDVPKGFRTRDLRIENHCSKESLPCYIFDSVKCRLSAVTVWLGGGSTDQIYSLPTVNLPLLILPVNDETIACRPMRCNHWSLSSEAKLNRAGPFDIATIHHHGNTSQCPLINEIMVRRSPSVRVHHVSITIKESSIARASTGLDEAA